MMMQYNPNTWLVLTDPFCNHSTTNLYGCGFKLIELCNDGAVLDFAQTNT